MEPKNRKVYLVGIGMGSHALMTEEAIHVFEKSDVIIGAKRMLEAVAHFQKPFYIAYKSEEIYSYLEAHKNYQTVAIALSGDIGFYSGAKKIAEVLSHYDVELVCGISSVVYFAAKLKLSWEDAAFVSLHGRYENIVGTVKQNKKTFLLLGNQITVQEICEKLTYYGLGDVFVHVGEELSYEKEKITTGRACEFVKKSFSALAVVFILNQNPIDRMKVALRDEDFIRGEVPMTKEEIRKISVSKLQLEKNSIVYDIGAGTGSVSIETALCAPNIQVFAIEKKKAGITLIEGNKRKFAADNITVIEGVAPQALENLPIPTHAFLGGTTGKLKEILLLLLKKNPSIRIVINAISLETMANILDALHTLPLIDVDIVQISVARCKNISAYHMMMGENPVFVISCSGKEITEELV